MDNLRVHEIIYLRRILSEDNVLLHALINEGLDRGDNVGKYEMNLRYNESLINKLEDYVGKNFR